MYVKRSVKCPQNTLLYKLSSPHTFEKEARARYSSSSVLEMAGGRLALRSVTGDLNEPQGQSLGPARILGNSFCKPAAASCPDACVHGIYFGSKKC